MSEKITRREFLKRSVKIGTAAAVVTATERSPLGFIFNKDRVQAQEIEQFPTFPLESTTINNINQLISERNPDSDVSLDTFLGDENFTNIVVNIGDIDLSDSPAINHQMDSLLTQVQQLTGDPNPENSLNASFYINKNQEGQLEAMPMLQVDPEHPSDYNGLRPDGLIWLDESGQLNSIEYPDFADASDTDIVVTPLTKLLAQELSQVTGTLTLPDGQTRSIQLETPPLGSPIICTRDKTTGNMKSLVTGEYAIIFTQFIPQNSNEPTPVPQVAAVGEVPTPEPKQAYIAREVLAPTDFWTDASEYPGTLWQGEHAISPGAIITESHGILYVTENGETRQIALEQSSTPPGVEEERIDVAPIRNIRGNIAGIIGQRTIPRQEITDSQGNSIVREGINVTDILVAVPTRGTDVLKIVISLPEGHMYIGNLDIKDSTNPRNSQEVIDNTRPGSEVVLMNLYFTPANNNHDAVVSSALSMEDPIHRDAMQMWATFMPTVQNIEILDQYPRLEDPSIKVYMGMQAIKY